MKKHLIFSILFTTLGMAQQRYLDSMFAVQQTDADRIYASALQLRSPYAGESATQSVSLKMHIFQPVGDAALQRPMLLCFHGGAFVSGTKEHDDMMTFCRLFAAKGYVTATAQYRLGMNGLSAISGTRSVYRALQDCRALIRYVKHNAAALKIDTSKVFVLGSSAGGFIGLQAAYMNKASEKPSAANAVTNFPPTLDDGPDLGSLDAVEPQYAYDGMPDAVIALWGGVKDTVLIEASDGTPVLLVHGTSDAIVPFEVGPPFNLSSLPPTYGSSPIHRRLTNLGIPHSTYFVPGAGHEFYGVSNGMWNPAPNVYWDTVCVKVTQFLFPRVTSVAVEGFSSVPDKFELLQNYPNPFNPLTNVEFRLKVNSKVKLAIFDLLGREVAVLVNGEKEAGTYSVQWDASRFASGLYFCRFTADNFESTKRIVLLS
jgi:acetyl esterase/lipase